MSYSVTIKTRKKSKFSVKRMFLYAFLILLAIITFLPFYLMIMNATHANTDIATKLNWFPGNQFLVNLRRTYSQVDIVRGFRNSLIISVSTTALAAYFGALTAFAFSKYKFKGNKVLFWVVIGSMMFPPQLGLVGYYDICVRLKLIDNLLAVILPMAASANLVFFVKLYIDATVPDSILESARIDGCSEFKIFNQIVLPMIVPSIATMSIFTFFISWNNYLQPLLVFNNPKLDTIPLITAKAKGVYRTDFGAVYVIVALSMIPIMIVFAFASKYIISGLTAGAVKE